MTRINEFYKCRICGNLVNVIEAGAGALVCCGKEMELLKEHTIMQEGKEKHVPIIKMDGNNLKVKVGSIEHPMSSEHFIELIQVIQRGRVVAQKQLIPNEKPEAEFCLQNAGAVKVRALCNIHGLWMN
ncbi:MAG: desulfoferrodoxin [archaeon]|jgi:superoxide reductase